MRQNRRNGFTFVEILVAMTVFGVLSAMAIPRYRNLKEKAYATTMRTDLGELRVAQEAYWAEHQEYATAIAALDFKPSSEVQLTVTSAEAEAGYTAVATHILLADQQCATYVGREAVGVPSGDIICGPPKSVAASGTTQSP